MVKFKDDIVWEAESPITVDVLNFMGFNDIFVNNHFFETKVSNIQRDGSLRDGPHDPAWIINHGALFAREIDVTPNNWSFDEDDFPYFEGEYGFPGNNYFDNDYKPIVILTPKGNRGFPQTVTLRTVNPEGFTYTFYILKDEVPADRHFYMDILAMGIKPVADNDLDNDADLPDPGHLPEVPPTP